MNQQKSSKKLGDVEAKALVRCCDPSQNALQSSVQPRNADTSLGQKSKKHITQDSVETDGNDEELLPPEVP